MSGEIRFAKKQDIPSLCEIWKSCFTDSDDYINLFYEKNFERVKVLAYYEGDKPVSMIHLIESMILNQSAKFIYAVGTLPEYRKRGYMSALIRYLTDEAKKSGYALFLKPSSPSTARLYKSLGFEEEAFLKALTVSPLEKQPITVYDLSAEEYNLMREEAFKDEPHIKWGSAHIKWCIEENEYYSGKTLGIKYNDGDCFLLGYPENKTLIINETDLSPKLLREVSGALCDIFSTEQIKAYMPVFCSEGEKCNSALLYNSKVKSPYVNMIMI